MRPKSVVAFSAILFMAVLLLRCERTGSEILNTESAPADSSTATSVPDLALVGDWSGKTSHQTQVALKIRNVNGFVYVTHFSGVFRCFSIKYTWDVNATDPDGLARITGGEFFYEFTDSTQSSWSIGGRFVSFYTLSGGFQIKVIDPASGEECSEVGIFKASR